MISGVIDMVVPAHNGQHFGVCVCVGGWGVNVQLDIDLGAQ